MPIESDAERWPTLVLRFVGRCSDADWSQTTALVRRLAAAGEPFCVVCDGTKLAVLPTPSRIRIAAELSEALRNDGHFSVLGWANVAPSALLRAAISGINWLSPAPYPIYNAPSLRDAVAWCEAALRPLARPVQVDLEALGE